MPACLATGPETMSMRAQGCVVACAPHALTWGSSIASAAAISTGRAVALHPAMTALAATASTVAWAMRGGTGPSDVVGEWSVPVSIRSTRSGVGGITAMPSLHPWASAQSWNSSRSSGAFTGVGDARALDVDQGCHGRLNLSFRHQTGRRSSA